MDLKRAEFLADDGCQASCAFHIIRAVHGGFDGGAADCANNDEQKGIEPTALQTDGQQGEFWPQEQPHQDVAEWHPRHHGSLEGVEMSGNVRWFGHAVRMALGCVIWLVWLLLFS